MVYALKPYPCDTHNYKWTVMANSTLCDPHCWLQVLSNLPFNRTTMIHKVRMHSNPTLLTPTVGYKCSVIAGAHNTKEQTVLFRPKSTLQQDYHDSLGKNPLKPYTCDPYCWLQVLSNGKQCSLGPNLPFNRTTLIHIVRMHSNPTLVTPTAGYKCSVMANSALWVQICPLTGLPWFTR